ncbi:MAG: ring-hydroxylating dioxygenase subunit beta [Chloroflexi bacterium]|nr:MAG: ring-hydroxylating dioxygenase subunit beta [Chloroflexota bacterium]
MGAVDVELVREVEQLIYREARLADEHDYAGWEALWTDDAVYWVPASDTTDPTTQMSIIHDNRSRIRIRIRQLETGKRHAQAPPSRLCRTVTNVELLGDRDGDVVAGANVLVVESRERGLTLWAGRCEYRLRRGDEGWRMAGKTVRLVDADRALHTLAFLI